ncbi:hypothetical protein [Nostoc sp. 'Peltigera membranacea cyanobiont' 232]|uniref:hypothetical protein n=1 Tax=Nostoc sp. 'Peltigera membranacea cyanobiont' 232 TaxID=2014531 RepID=UPI000B95B455|nr:hypothetical protein [Nostoc sp. 'Peltigera membranacea cyanobiont' 232]OYD99860.1 hypothetical protein CDG79_38430 [Nostoc sp. 'Peltigera membranacea cyanobiont' 232]
MKHNSDVPGQLALFAITPTVEIRATIHDPHWDEILAPQQEDDNHWNPADFGEVPHKLDGQLTIFSDDSQEPPDPDDYENLEDYEQAWAGWVGVKVGDLVKLSNTWMNKCAAATTGKFRKDYQYKSDNELISEVIWVDPRGRGHIYVGRGNNNALFVPCGCYTVETRVGAQVKGDTVPAIVETRVGAQVSQVTQKVAPQHDTHWVEKYWVERPGNKYWYFRYCWMQGRKKNRCYLGGVDSNLARRKKADVEIAIADGKLPIEIKDLIRGWKNESPTMPKM